MRNWAKILLGIAVGKFVLPAQFRPVGQQGLLKAMAVGLKFSSEESKKEALAWESFLKHNASLPKQDRLFTKREFYKTPDGIELDTIELQNKNSLNSKKVILFGWGRSGCYERHLDFLGTEAQNLNAKIVTFNYRGIGHSSSQPSNANDLVDDYYAQVQRLIKQGYKPENIYCYGHSLGGAVASMAAAKLHKEKNKVHIYNDRSYSKLIDISLDIYSRPGMRKLITTLAMSLIFYLSISYMAYLSVLTPITFAVAGVVAAISYFHKPLYNFLEKSIIAGWLHLQRKAMEVTGWEMLATAAHDSIPNEYKDHVLVKKSSHETSKSNLGERSHIHPCHDRVISHQYSLHKHSESRKKYKQQTKQKLNALEAQLEFANKYPAFTKQQDQLKQQIAQTKHELRKISNAKMTGGDHTTDPSKLLSRYKNKFGRNISGQERFYDFVEPDGRHNKKVAPRYKAFRAG